MRSQVLRQQRADDKILQYLNSRTDESECVPTYGPNLFARDPILAPSLSKRASRSVRRMLLWTKRAMGLGLRRPA